MDDELETLEKYIEESKEKFASRRRLRESNQRENIEYPNEATLNELDSSIKKNSAFVKRLKVFSASQKEPILNEIERLNLTKFISEVASSIIEAKLKLNDVQSVIEICTKLNRTYKEFSRHLLEQYVKYFPIIKKKQTNQHDISYSSSNLILTPHCASGGGGGGGNVGQVSNVNLGSLSSKITTSNNELNQPATINPSKIRVDLRLFAELIICGIFPLKDSFPVLMNLLCYLMVYEKSNHQNANAILTFCKVCGDELLGLVPKNIQHLASKYDKQLPTSDLIPLKRQESLKTYVRDYYQSILKHLRNLQAGLSDLVNKNKKIYKAKGEVSKDLKELLDIKHSDYQKVYNVLNQLGELLGEPSLEFSDDIDSFKDQNIINTDINLIEPSTLSNTNELTSGLWDDEGTKAFYEDLLDLKALFPNLVVKVSSITSKKSQPLQVSRDVVKVNSEQPVELVNLSPDSPDNQAQSDDKTLKSGENVKSSSELDVSKCEEAEDDLNSSSSSDGEDEDSNNTRDDTSSPKTTSKLPQMTLNSAIANRTQPEQYFTKLSNCVNKDIIDSAAIDFIRFFNTKFGRKKLVKTLFNVQRTRLDLLPFFARLTATIYPYVPSVGNELVSALKLDFRNLFKKKDQINIESKVKNVRFIGELVKFNLYSKQEGLNCLKMLLSDFTHHHIEMTCNLLETCGRFLYKSNESHHQLRLLLEQMMRKKLLLSVDSKYITMIENAYYFTNPPEIIKQVIVEPPVHIYVRYLLCECLNRSTIDKVLEKIKKIDWEDKKLAKFAINCMIQAYNLKFYNIRYLAALLAALNKGHQWISVAVIDGVVEDILLMMEINELQFNQRRIPMMRYFGELYNYRLSDSSLVFKVLYSLITYGVYYPEPEQTLSQIPMAHLDPPDNLFRIKLVCDLLETCGQYLNSVQERKKLDCYLLFFERYYWCKKHIYLLHPYCLAKGSNQFPASIEYLYNDAIYNLRPKFQMSTSYSQAIESVKSFIDNLAATNN